MFAAASVPDVRMRLAAPMDESDRTMSLVTRAVAGDEAALTLLLAESAPGLRAYLSGRIPAALRGTIDADDITQDAQVEVFRHIRSFEPRGPGSFDRWVRTIALRELRDVIRARRAARRGGERVAVRAPTTEQEDSMVGLLDVLSGPGASPSRSVARHEAVAAVQAAIEGLPEDYRQAVWLVYIEGQPVSAAAAAMGRTERAIHNLCYKAKDRMRHLLGSQSRFLSGS